MVKTAVLRIHDTYEDIMRSALEKGAASALAKYLREMTRLEPFNLRRRLPRSGAERSSTAGDNLLDRIAVKRQLAPLALATFSMLKKRITGTNEMNECEVVLYGALSKRADHLLSLYAKVLDLSHDERWRWDTWLLGLLPEGEVHSLDIADSTGIPIAVKLIKADADSWPSAEEWQLGADIPNEIYYGRLESALTGIEGSPDEWKHILTDGEIARIGDVREALASFRAKYLEIERSREAEARLDPGATDAFGNAISEDLRKALGILAGFKHGNPIEMRIEEGADFSNLYQVNLLLEKKLFTGRSAVLWGAFADGAAGQLAARILESLVKDFLEGRAAQEVGNSKEAVALLIARLREWKEQGRSTLVLLIDRSYSWKIRMGGEKAYSETGTRDAGAEPGQIGWMHVTSGYRVPVLAIPDLPAGVDVVALDIEGVGRISELDVRFSPGVGTHKRDGFPAIRIVDLNLNAEEREKVRLGVTSWPEGLSADETAQVSYLRRHVMVRAMAGMRSVREGPTRSIAIVDRG